MEITVSQGTLTAMGLAMAICFLLPVSFIVINRHKLVLKPAVCGLAAWCVFSYYIAGMLLGTLMKADGAFGAVLMALFQSIIILIGHFVLLKFLSSSSAASGVPLSYGLGYSLINLVFIAGIQQFFTISLATTVNNNGFEKVATTVEDSQALYEILESINSKPIYEHVVGTAELIFFFTVTVSVCVLMWYAVTKQKYSYIGIAFAAEILSLGSVLMYTNGVINSILVTEAVYLIVCVAVAVYAYKIYHDYEGGIVYSDDPVDRFDYFRKH